MRNSKNDPSIEPTPEVFMIESSLYGNSGQLTPQGGADKATIIFTYKAGHVTPEVVKAHSSL